MHKFSHLYRKDCLFKNRYACIFSFESTKNSTHKIFGSTDSTNVLKHSIKIQIFVTDDTIIVQIRLLF